MIPVILAGGSGTRFWPLSRRDEPKQLLSILGDHSSMIEETILRLGPMTTEERPVYVVCRPDLVEPTLEVLKTDAKLEFIEEPVARNTGPAIALATAHLEHLYGDEPVAFFPADHFIAGQKGFEQCLALAARRATDGAIVTLGIPPTRPETGYGYIECTQKLTGGSAPEAHPVEAFIEKPNAALALEYLKAGRYLWNSGIFIFRPSTLWAELRRQQPELSEKFDAIRNCFTIDPTSPTIGEQFTEVASISIDYAVMEGAERVEVIPALFRWSDVGHWGALHEVIDTDDRENIVDADALVDECDRCVLFSRGSSRLIAASGLQDLIIVDTPDALLVLPRERAQRVKELVALLRDKDRRDLL